VQLRINPAVDSNGFFQVIAAFSLLLLAMLGIGGMLYNLFTPGGWLSQVFERSVAGGIAALLAIFMVGLCAWLTAKEISRPI